MVANDFPNRRRPLQRSTLNAGMVTWTWQISLRTGTVKTAQNVDDVQQNNEILLASQVFALKTKHTRSGLKLHHRLPGSLGYPRNFLLLEDQSRETMVA